MINPTQSVLKSISVSPILILVVIGFKYFIFFSDITFLTFFTIFIHLVLFLSSILSVIQLVLFSIAKYSMLEKNDKNY